MYGVRKFFSPVLVSGVYNSTQADALSVYITNDQPWAVKGNTSASPLPSTNSSILGEKESLSVQSSKMQVVEAFHNAITLAPV